MKAKRFLLFQLVLCVALISTCWNQQNSDSSESAARASLTEFSDETNGNGRTLLEVAAMNYPPYTDPNRKGWGLSFELMSEAFRGSRYRIEPRFMPPARCEAEFTAGAYPVSLYNNLTFGRMEELEQVNTITVYYNFFYDSSRGTLEWETLDDLKDKRVGVIRVRRDSAGRNQLIDEGLIPVAVDSQEQMFRLLHSGRVDLVLSVELTAIEMVKNLFPGYDTIRPTESKYMTIIGGPWFHQKHPDGKGALESYRAGIERMKADGTYDRILQKYR